MEVFKGALPLDGVTVVDQDTPQAVLLRRGTPNYLQIVGVNTKEKGMFCNILYHTSLPTHQCQIKLWLTVCFHCFQLCRCTAVWSANR